MPRDPDTGAGTEAAGLDGDGAQGPLAQTADVARGATGEAIAEPRPSEKTFKRTFSSLSLPSFRNFWLGMLLQQGAMQMQMLARGYFVFELTGSPALLGVVSVAGAGPSLVLGLFGGVLADRMDKKRVVQWGQKASMLLALFIALSITTDTITWQHLVGASVVQGALLPVMMPARQAIVPQLVPREWLMNAVALGSMAMSFTTLAGPAVAGGIIVWLGIDGVYYAVTAMFAGSLIFTGLLPSFPPRARDPGEKRPPVLEDLKEGLRYVRGKKVILQLLLMAFATMMLAMPIRMALPIFAKETFSVGAAGLGIMLSFIGVGGLVGALFIASAGNVARRG